MGKKVKKQHYVPQFYLKSFSLRKTLKGKKNFSINVFDKDLEKIYLANIKNIAQEKFFYDKDGHQLIEKNLSQIESACSKVYNSLVHEQNFFLMQTSQKRDYVSLFISIQFLRTKDMRLYVKDMVESFKKELYKDYELLPEDLIEQLEELTTEKSIKNGHLRHFGDILDLIDIFNSKRWCLLINETETPFWTSDSPIVKFNPFLTEYGNLGLSSPGIQLFFPLSPKLCLCLLDPKRYITYNKMRYGEKEHHFKDYIEVDVYAVNLRDIAFLNRLQVLQSVRHVFSNSDDFSLAESIIEFEPDQLIRKRVEMKTLEDNPDIIHVKPL